MFMLEEVPLVAGLLAVELVGLGVEEELDDFVELPDELEFELLERSSRRESSLERPRQSRRPLSRSLPRSPPRSPRSPPERRLRSRRSSRLSPSDRELRLES